MIGRADIASTRVARIAGRTSSQVNGCYTINSGVLAASLQGAGGTAGTRKPLTTESVGYIVSTVEMRSISFRDFLNQVPAGCANTRRATPNQVCPTLNHTTGA
jgi:hypothetical protein